jgi:hypothetical protein
MLTMQAYHHIVALTGKTTTFLANIFFAVFKTNAAWDGNSLPMNSKNNPFINLDIDHFSNSSDFSVQMEDNAG